MLSEKVQQNIAMIVKLKDETDKLIIEETGGRYGLCNGTTPQLYCYDKPNSNLKELEDLVGPVMLKHVYADGDRSYSFKLNGVLCHVIMPADTLDAPTGGASNDVSVD